MGNYEVTWITEQLAAGHAPLSYDDLETIKARGIDVIVNLCGEFCDLHEIQEDSGFAVYYLPIADECAPDMGEMEKALAWLEQKLAQGHKALVHCRFGVGRTGTFVSVPNENRHRFKSSRKNIEKNPCQSFQLLSVEIVAPVRQGVKKKTRSVRSNKRYCASAKQESIEPAVDTTAVGRPGQTGAVESPPGEHRPCFGKGQKSGLAVVRAHA